jgi:putative sterol carrier protein
MTETTDEVDMSSIWGVHTIPALAGVRGQIEFVGPRGSAHMEIDDGRVTLSPQAGEADVVIRSDENSDLLRLVRGELNVVIAVLQGRVEASGDLLLALKVAGALPGLGRTQTSAAPAQAGA